MDFDQLYTNVKIGVGKTATRLEQATGLASRHLKLAAAEQKMQDAYILLGRIAYRNAVTPSPEAEEEMAKAVKIVASARKAVRSMREEIRLQKEAQETLSAPKSNEETL